jgi:glycosyltransferase involved in cell wall biosynthesis
MDLRVCILSSFKGTGGVQTYTFELARILGFKGLKIYLVAQELNEDDRALLEKANVTPIMLNLRFSKIAYILNMPYQLDINKKIYKEFDVVSKCDLLHFTSSLYGFNYQGEKRFIVTSWHSLSTKDFIKSLLKYYGFLRAPVVSAAYFQYFLMERAVHKKAFAIICPTKYIYFNMVKEFGGKARYIPPPLNLPPHMRSKSKNDKLRILFIANDLSLPKKNLKTLLRSLRLLSSEKLTKKVIVTLVGSYNKGVMHLVNQQKNNVIKIEMTGLLRRRNLDLLYENSDLLVFPSFLMI